MSCQTLREGGGHVILLKTNIRYLRKTQHSFLPKILSKLEIKFRYLTSSYTYFKVFHAQGGEREL